MGLFGPDMPKRITKEEWEEIRQNLYGDLDDKERIELEKFFRADLHETGIEAGIKTEEFKAGMTWLRANMKKHTLEEDDLDLITTYFEKHLRD